MKLKLHLLLFYPSTWYIRDFFLFHIEIEGKGGWIIYLCVCVCVGGGGGGGGGGGQRVCWPPSQIIGWGAWPPPPLYLRLWVTESNDTCILASYISN